MCSLLLVDSVLIYKLMCINIIQFLANQLYPTKYSTVVNQWYCITILSVKTCRIK